MENATFDTECVMARTETSADDTGLVFIPQSHVKQVCTEHFFFLALALVHKENYTKEKLRAKYFL